MADLTPYAITLGATDYPSKYAGLLGYLEPYLNDVETINSGVMAGLRNHLINGAFSINYRAPATNADDTYAHDRWYALTQTGTIAVTTLNNVADGTPFMARLTQSQVTAQRMGYAQIIEGINCRHLRGREVTFRLGGVRLSTASNVRMAVLEWTGTEDAVTSDVVNNWTATVYTAGNFFLASNLTVSGVVQQALTANTLTDGSAVTVTLGSSFNNLIVFVWTESAVAQNVTLDLGKAQLEIGSVATLFEHRPIGAELALCQRYYQKSYDQGTVPGAVAASAFRHTIEATCNYASVSSALPVVMRATPTGTVYSPGTGAAGNVRIDSVDAVALITATTTSVLCYVNNVSFVVNQFLSAHYVLNSEL